MGLLQKLFPGKTAQVKYATEYLEALNYRPVFHSWKGAIYEQEQVRAAIDALARHTSKLAVCMQGSAQPSLQARLKRHPNEFQTWSQFLMQARIIYEVDTTLFIVPTYDKYGQITGIYPVTPQQATIEEYQGTLYIRYIFRNRQVAVMELENCAILTKFQYDREFFGGGNGALQDTLSLLHLQNQGIQEGIKNSASFRFMARHKRPIDPEDLEKEQNRFTEKHLKGKSGFLLFASDYDDIKQIDSKPFVVDAEQKRLIDANINNYFGVNERIMQNAAGGDEWSAFYEGAIEPFSIQLSECLTKMLFTDREQAQGSGVMFTSNRMQYMSNSDKLKVSAQLADRGVLSINDVREIWNLPPVEGGDVRTIRGEYYSATDKLEEVEEGAEGGNDGSEESAQNA